MKRNAKAWTLLMLAIAMSPALAQRASDERMAQEALMPYVSSDPLTPMAELDSYRDDVETAALRAPNQRRSATVIFGHGLPPAEAINILETNRQTPLRYDFKASVGDDGTIMSLSIGTDDLLRFDGRPLYELSAVSSWRPTPESISPVFCWAARRPAERLTTRV